MSEEYKADQTNIPDCRGRHGMKHLEATVMIFRDWKLQKATQNDWKLVMELIIVYISHQKNSQDRWESNL